MKTIATVNKMSQNEKPARLLLVTLACLVRLNLACSVGDSPFEEFAEGDQSCLGVVHGLEDGLAGLCGAVRWCQTESAGHCCCPLDEVVEFTIRDLTTARGIDLDERCQEEFVQACILPRILVGHCTLNGLEEIGLGVVGNVVEINFFRGVNVSNLACNVGGGPVGELGGANPATSRALLAVNCVEHGFSGSGALLHRATVLCLPRWSIA